jgi:hypothetical protein
VIMHRQISDRFSILFNLFSTKHKSYLYEYDFLGMVIALFRYGYCFSTL